MADKADAAKDAGSDGENVGGKKSKKIKLIGALVCVGVASGAYVLGTRSASPVAAGAEVSTTTTTIPLIDGCVKKPDTGIPKKIIDLPAISINLADGHYLRLAVSLGLCADVVLESPDAFLTAPARDTVVSTLSGMSVDDLSTETGRDQIKKTLSEEIAALYPGVVYEVFFAEFVTQ